MSDAQALKDVMGYLHIHNMTCMAQTVDDARRELVELREQLGQARAAAIPWRDGRTVPDRYELIVYREADGHLETAYFVAAEKTGY